MFFYSENYNYPLHKWDGQPKITINPYRYQVVFEHIKAILGISINDFLMDTNIDFNEILLEMGSIHSKEYLDALQEDAYYYAYCFGEFELSKTPIGLLRKTFLYPQLAHALGTYEATRYAIDKGFAISLGGGHHHALRDLGEGFSLINDIAFAAQKLGDKKILIVDADAHRGNGVAQIVGQLKNIFIYDLYNCENYPTGDEYKEFIDYGVELLPLTADKEYLSIFKKYLNESVDEVSPELIIYNAGSDILHGDSVGYLDVSLDGLRQRDEMVAQMCKNKNIPIAIVLSGGYKQEYFFEVSNSIANMAKILTPIH